MAFVHDTHERLEGAKQSASISSIGYPLLRAASPTGPSAEMDAFQTPHAIAQAFSAGQVFW
jgi:hypothetical protein